MSDVKRFACGHTSDVQNQIKTKTASGGWSTRCRECKNNLDRANRRGQGRKPLAGGKTPVEKAAYNGPKSTLRNWVEEAACAGDDTNLWFPERLKTGPTAKSVNQTAYRHARYVCEHLCPVREQCLQYAIDQDIREGMFGGKTPVERKNIRRGLKDE